MFGSFCFNAIIHQNIRRTTFDCRWIGLRIHQSDNYYWQQVNGLATGRSGHAVVNAPKAMVPSWRWKTYKNYWNYSLVSINFRFCLWIQYGFRTIYLYFRTWTCFTWGRCKQGEYKNNSSHISDFNSVNLFICISLLMCYSDFS